MHQHILGSVLLAVTLLAPPTALSAALSRLAQPGPWPGVSQLVGYNNQVWFVNSTKFVNHNSADIYGFDLASRLTRYERHLFSQDAGTPAIAGGLLYWPYEDGRFSVGRGEYMVTNGRDWEWRVLPAGRAFHVHVMHAHEGVLYAATSAWEARVHRRSEPTGPREYIYEHPTPEHRVSRITSLASLGPILHAGLTSRSQSGPKLLRWTRQTFEPVSLWPHSTGTEELTTFQGELYALNDTNGEVSAWRTDGTRVEPLAPFASKPLRGFSSDGEHLWAMDGDRQGGTLWRSADGQAWTPIGEIRGALPLDVLAYKGQVFVGSIGPDKRGTLWGTVALASTATPPASYAGSRNRAPEQPYPVVPAKARRATTENSIGAARSALMELDHRLNRPQEFSNYRDALRASLIALINGPDPLVADALAVRLGRRYADESVNVFGGATSAPRDTLNKWYLLWAIAQHGTGEVPISFLTPAWNRTPNPAEKYFGFLPGAAWAASQLGQHDHATLAALISALGHPSHPAWLTGDLVGALTVLTGRNFGYDIALWKARWAGREAMRYVPGGRFTMSSDEGEPAERPSHPTRVASFWMDKYEVTRAAFSRFVSATGHVTDPERVGKGWHWTDAWREVADAHWRDPHGPGQGPLPRADSMRHPGVQVSWHDARAYCLWVGKRLPTEAEWELAARGETARTYAWGSQAPDAEGIFRASYGRNECCAAEQSDGYRFTAPVGEFPRGQSARGIFDLTGNVWEWVEDSYEADCYARAPSDNPVNRALTERKVIRGGGWGNDAQGLRATLRHSNRARDGLSMVGFRCARSAENSP